MRSPRARLDAILSGLAPVQAGLGLFALYYLGCALSALMVHDVRGIALFWPGAGIALAGLLRFGIRNIWAVPLALLLHYATFSPASPTFLPVSMLAHTAGALAGVRVAQRGLQPGRFDTRNGLVILFGGVVLSIVSATIAVVGLKLTGLAPPPELTAAWVQWVLGNLLGVAAVGPLLMLAPGLRSGAVTHRDDTREPERLLWLVALALSFLVMAWGTSAGGPYPLGMTALPLAVLTWSAIRFDAWWTALGTLAMNVLIGTFSGLDLAGFDVPTRPLDLAQLLGYLVVMSVLPIMVTVAAHERRAATRRLLRAAAIDPLTGLLNRNAFEQAARTRLDDPASPPRALAYIDLDHLKLVNDTASHAAGDALIRGVAGLLQANVRAQDVLGHLGGDSFAVLLHNVLPAAAEGRAAQLLREIGAYRVQWQGRALGTTASVGLVPLHREETDFARLLSQADAACFTAKESGGDQVCLASMVGGERFDHTRAMHSAIRAREAVENRRLVLYAQAIVPMHPDAPEGRHFEILLRLRDTTGELLLPGQFYPAAGRFRLGVLIDREVVQMSLDWLERHADPREVDLCSINLSAEALGDESFLAFIADRLRRSTFPLEKLCLEITETSALRDIARAQRFIAQMHELGCRFALDDFGTGFSSFGYLRSLDVDFFKIDGSFVRDLDSSPLSVPIVRAITDIAHTLERHSIAEHAETPAQIEALRRLGVDMVQGYAMHRPEPIEHYFARSVGEIALPRMRPA